jgi:hypothetical protein
MVVGRLGFCHDYYGEYYIGTFSLNTKLLEYKNDK